MKMKCDKVSLFECVSIRIIKVIIGLELHDSNLCILRVCVCVMYSFELEYLLSMVKLENPYFISNETFVKTRVTIRFLT